MVKAKALVDKALSASKPACKRRRTAGKNPKRKNKQARVYKKKTCAKPKKQTGWKSCSTRGKKPKSILKRKRQRNASASNLCHVQCLQCLGNICNLARAGITPSEMQIVLRHRYSKWQ
ncbi:hypothetical protein KR074_001026 [Drosophila pseudoananassae]|nr:hypothetical protein KR074_001026 [Drosophila pseudoananassae]